MFIGFSQVLLYVNMQNLKSWWEKKSYLKFSYHWHISHRKHKNFPFSLLCTSSLRVKSLTDAKLVGFRSQLEAIERLDMLKSCDTAKPSVDDIFGWIFVLKFYLKKIGAS